MNYPLLPNQMPPAIKKVWHKTLLTSTGFLSIVLLVIGFIFSDFFLNNTTGRLIFGGSIVGILLFIGVGFAIVPYRYGLYRYEVTPELLTFQKGYFFRTITYVPMNRIQHVTTEQGPYLRKEQLMELVVHTAATNHSLAGLNVEDAMALREQIIQYVKAAVEDV